VSSFPLRLLSSASSPFPCVLLHCSILFIGSSVTIVLCVAASTSFDCSADCCAAPLLSIHQQELCFPSHSPCAIAQWHAFRQRLQSTMQLTLGVAELQSHLLLASAVIVKCAVNLCYCCIALALLSAARERFSVQLASLRCARCAVPCYAMRCCCKERTAFTFTLSVHQAQFMHRPLFS